MVFCRILQYFVAKSVVLRFTLFCREISFGTIYALLRGEKFSEQFFPWRKNDKYEVCVNVDTPNLGFPYILMWQNPCSANDTATRYLLLDSFKESLLMFPIPLRKVAILMMRMMVVIVIMDQCGLFGKWQAFFLTISLNPLFLVLFQCFISITIYQHR